MKVGVVYGGTAEEREASSKNAADIAAVLKERGYQVQLIPFEKDFVHTLKSNGVDLVYVCTQGKGYGDGTIQGILEHEGIPFTGSGMSAAALINDKILCKLLFDRYQIPTPHWEILDREQYESGTFDYEGFGYPFVAKAPTQGGSFGIELITCPDDLDRIRNVFHYDDPILLERFVNGRFYTVGLYESKGHLIVLPVVEGVDDEKNNHTFGEDGIELISFTGSYSIRQSSLDGELSKKMGEIAQNVFRVTHAKGVGRVDFMVEENTGHPYVLEINAVPGLKKASLMPQEAKMAGIEYGDMIEDILLSAQ